jgi:hypothetical protein
LDHFKNGRGNWIRTSDLFVPKNQSKPKLRGRKHREAARKSVEFELQKQAKIDRKMQIILRIAEIACPAYAPQTSGGLASTAPSPERRAK